MYVPKPTTGNPPHGGFSVCRNVKARPQRAVGLVLDSCTVVSIYSLHDICGNVKN